jgi:hypothetical protein
VSVNANIRPPSTRSAALWISLAAVLTSVAGFYWTLDGYFQGDDFAYVGRYFHYPWAQWPSLFVRGWADDMWSAQLRELRPINALAFMVDAKLWGLDPFGFRLTNLFLHAACAALVGFIAWHVTRRQLTCAIAATILFALHPVNAHAVAWITGRVDVLSTMFYLGAFLAFLKFRTNESAGNGWIWLLTLSFAGLLFTKEVGFTFPLMLVVADLAWLGHAGPWRDRRAWTPYIASAVTLAVYMLCRKAAFGIAGPAGVGAGLPNPTNRDFYAELIRRQGAYLAHLFPPTQPWLREWRDAGFPLSASHLVHVALLVGLLIAIVSVAWRWSVRAASEEERRAFMFFAIGWYLVATLPLEVTYFSARHLYLAGAGISIAAVLVMRGISQSRSGFAFAAIAVAVFLGQQLSSTLRPWHRAAQISHEIAREVSQVERDAASGSALILDVPDLIDGAFCWSWSVPYSVRPPFQLARLDERIPVVERPGAYVFTRGWRDQTAFAALPGIQQTCWLIQVTDDGRVRRIAIAPDKIRAAAEHLANARAPREQDDQWRDFIAELAPPTGRE